MKFFAIFFSSLLLLFCSACEQNSSNIGSFEPPQDSIIYVPSTNAARQLEADEKRRQQVFVALVQGMYKEDSEGFLQEFKRLYGENPKLGELQELQKMAIYGFGDSLMLLSFAYTEDSTCAGANEKKLFIFNKKGQLLYEQAYYSLRQVQVWEEKEPLLLLCITSCDAKGKHNLYRGVAGELVNVLNPLEEETPPSYDAQAYNPAEMRLEVKDLNRDSMPDLFFSTESYRLTTESKRIKDSKFPLHMAFLYRPSKESFVWQGK